MAKLPTKRKCLKKALELCDDYDYFEALDTIKCKHVIENGEPNNMFWFTTDQLIEFIDYCKGIDKNQTDLMTENEN